MHGYSGALCVRVRVRVRRRVRVRVRACVCEYLSACAYV